MARKLLFACTCLAALFVCSCSTRTSLSVEDLTVELLENPLGIAEQNPRLSWRIGSGKQDILQQSYRIIVVASEDDIREERNLIWDSGDNPSPQSLYVLYEGPALESREDYYWRVYVADNHGNEAWSDVARWSMALADSDWQAQWIGVDSMLNPTDDMHRDVYKTRLAARYLRKEFASHKPVENARLYISGLGLYECYINGEKVGDDVFAPTATDYTKHVNYNTYDVTDMVKEGNNAIGVILGNGRFFPMRTETSPVCGVPPTRSYGFPKLLAQLEITYKDGTRETVASGTDWKLTTFGPIVANNEFDGEWYDARLEMPGWAAVGFDDSGWIAARKVDAPEGKLISQRNPNIKVMETIKPVSITELGDSAYVIDMGQNFSGWLEMKLKGKKDIPVKLRFAETLEDDGNLYVANLRGAEVTDTYIPASDGEFTWEPRFTSHGFRYAELTGVDYKPSLESFAGKVIYDDMKTTGKFASSNAMLDQIYKNLEWGLKSNYRSFPMDCPQRDERMGWLGDRGACVVGEAFMFRQALLYEKWAQDIVDAQLDNGMLPDLAPTYWPFYSPNVTYPALYMFTIEMLYDQFGDYHAVEKHYPYMKRWVDYIKNNLVEDDIVVKDTYGDWCMPPESPEMIHSQDPARRTDGRLIGTSFYYRLLGMMARFATLLGYDDDVEPYLEQARDVKAAYNAMFFNPGTASYSNGTVTANLISLMQGLVPEGFESRVFENLVDKTTNELACHISSGNMGMQFLMRGLTRNGRVDVAYALANQTTYPSWGYMIERGATTIWELWNGDTGDPTMNSGNHLMQIGDLMIWYFEDLAGIKSDKDQPGFKMIIMEPYFPQGLEWVDASTETLYGAVCSRWKKTDEGLSWKIEIPANTTARIRIPAASVESVKESGKPLDQNKAIKSASAANGFVYIEAGSGKYDLLADL